MASGMNAVAADEIHRKDAIVVQPGVKELDLERRARIAPEPMIGAEADVAPLIVRDLEEPVGDLALRVLERLGGEPLRLVGDRIQVEPGRVRRQNGHGEEGEQQARRDANRRLR